MRAQIQASYEERLSRYAELVHGNAPPGLVPKLAIYSTLLQEQSTRRDGLWKIEPMLAVMIHSVEIDLHLATAKLLEKSNRSDRSLFTFLEFCLKNREIISWSAGAPEENIIQAQLDALETHRPTITMIMARRDKFFAHLDRRYFNDPKAIYADYPLSATAVIALVNCVIDIVANHQRNLNDTVSFHVGEFYAIAIENMVRNLETGRRANFPGQLD